MRESEVIGLVGTGQRSHLSNNEGQWLPMALEKRSGHRVILAYESAR
jgi:hypothetical protein